VVIALLGILAAFALPRFASLESEARAATVQGLAGSLRSSSAMAHGLFLATGNTTVTMEGVDIDTINGYPTAEDIVNTLSDTTGFTAGAVTSGVVTITKDGAATAAQCSVQYTEAGSGGAPQFLVNVDDC
ncbi:MAG: hypothetical protein WD672_12320, partial [Woeseia sp.]